MTSDSAWMIVRYALVFLFTSVMHMSEGDVTKWVAIAGDVFTFGWAMWVKWGTKSVPASTAARADVPTVSPVTGMHQAGTDFRG